MASEWTTLNSPSHALLVTIDQKWDGPLLTSCAHKFRYTGWMERPNHIIVFSMSMWLSLCVQLFCLHFAKLILTAVHVTGGSLHQKFMTECMDIIDLYESIISMLSAITHLTVWVINTKHPGAVFTKNHGSCKLHTLLSLVIHVNHTNIVWPSVIITIQSYKLTTIVSFHAVSWVAGVMQKSPSDLQVGLFCSRKTEDKAWKGQNHLENVPDPLARAAALDKFSLLLAFFAVAVYSYSKN